MGALCLSHQSPGPSRGCLWVGANSLTLGALGWLPQPGMLTHTHLQGPFGHLVPPAEPVPRPDPYPWDGPMQGLAGGDPGSWEPQDPTSLEEGRGCLGRMALPRPRAEQEGEVWSGWGSLLWGGREACGRGKSPTSCVGATAVGLPQSPQPHTDGHPCNPGRHLGFGPLGGVAQSLGSLSESSLPLAGWLNSESRLPSGLPFPRSLPAG